MTHRRLVVRFARGLVVAAISLAFAACSGSPAASPAGTPSGSAAPSAAPSASANPTAHPSSIATVEEAMAVVARRSPWFDGIARKDATLIGQAAWWDAAPGPAGSYAVTVDVGWGDCPAGCIDHHVWHYTVAKDGTVTFVGQSGPPLPADQQAALVAAATSGGVGGEVTAGPVCPVERPGDSACAARSVAGAVLVVKNAAGTDVGTFTTDGSGLFRIDLPAGAYTMEPQPVTGLMGTAAAQPFTVVGDRLTALTVPYDTGIR